MRQRNIKNLSERIEQNSRLLIEEPGDCKGRWAEIFGNGNPIYLEIGCGKGTSSPNTHLPNRTVILSHVRDRYRSFFEHWRKRRHREAEISGFLLIL